jgi:hypothetical protein
MLLIHESWKDSGFSGAAAAAARNPTELSAAPATAVLMNVRRPIGVVVKSIEGLPRERAARVGEIGPDEIVTRLILKQAACHARPIRGARQAA